MDLSYEMEKEKKPDTKSDSHRTERILAPEFPLLASGSVASRQTISAYLYIYQSVYVPSLCIIIIKFSAELNMMYGIPQVRLSYIEKF